MAVSIDSCISPTDAIVVAVAQLVDDSQTERRDPSHWDLTYQIQRGGLDDVSTLCHQHYPAALCSLLW